MTVVKEILDYWFGNNADDLLVLDQYGKLWFGKDEKVDHEIKIRFGSQVEMAMRHGLIGEKEPLAHRYLATILLLDQFVRNIYRNEPGAFTSDHIALKLAQDAVAAGYDLLLRPIERVFLYLPFEHSENLAEQNRSVELFRQLKAAVPEDSVPAFDGFLDYAIRHQEIIARFGRFPHRNKILGRKSTGEEVEFLQQPGSSF
jgi:uncharacterized protein (DUF924 family)